MGKARSLGYMSVHCGSRQGNSREPALARATHTDSVPTKNDHAHSHMVDNLTTLSLCVSSGDLDLFDKKKLKRDIVYISERLEKAVFYKKSCKGEADVIQREIF